MKQNIIWNDGGRASATRETRWNLPRALAHLCEPEAAVQLAAFAARFWTDRFGVLGARDQRDLRRLACVQIGRPAVAAA